jgi:four helix bundle protein
LTAAHRFEELDVFQRAYKVSLEVHRFTLSMPQIEQRILADQLRRASKSICANLAEGFGKQSLSKTEFRRFVLMSIGSADEMRVWLRYCLDLGYLDSQRWGIGATNTNRSRRCCRVSVKGWSSLY